MGRPAKAIDTNSGKMSKEERNHRKAVEEKLKGDNSKIKPARYLNKRQKQIFKFLLDNLNNDILSNLDIYVLNNTAITIERIETIERMINEATPKDEKDIDVQTAVNLKSLRDAYSKDFFRYCNELSLSPQSRAKLSIATPPVKKTTLGDLLNKASKNERVN